jgi:hypothetical protein
MRRIGLPTSPITRRGFEGKRVSRLTPIGFVVLLTIVAGCQTTPPERALQLPAASLEVRQQQTRRFKEIDEAQLLAASAGVLQDLGFSLDESEVDLGLIVASKHSAVADSKVTDLLRLMALLTDADIVLDKEQRIRASLVSWPVSGTEQQFYVRVTFQRIVRNTDNDITKQQSLNDPVLYQMFFERLSKSVFLEAHSL